MLNIFCIPLREWWDNNSGEETGKHLTSKTAINKLNKFISLSNRYYILWKHNLMDVELNVDSVGWVLRKFNLCICGWRLLEIRGDLVECKERMVEYFSRDGKKGLTY